MFKQKRGKNNGERKFLNPTRGTGLYMVHFQVSFTPPPPFSEIAPKGDVAQQDQQRLVQDDKVPKLSSVHNKIRIEAKGELDTSDDSEKAELFLQDMAQIQREQLTQNRRMFQACEARDQHMEELIRQQREFSLFMTLPKVPIFYGDPIQYNQFIRLFDTLIEAKTSSSSARLSFLIQYTSGDVHARVDAKLLNDERSRWVPASERTP